MALAQALLDEAYGEVGDIADLLALKLCTTSIAVIRPSATPEGVEHDIVGI